MNREIDMAVGRKDPRPDMLLRLVEAGLIDVIFVGGSMHGQARRCHGRFHVNQVLQSQLTPPVANAPVESNITTEEYELRYSIEPSGESDWPVVPGGNGCRVNAVWFQLTRITTPKRAYPGHWTA